MRNNQAMPRISFPNALELRRPAWLAAFFASITCVGVLFLAGNAGAAEYYVAPTGSDDSPGTLAQPFATLQKGHDVASAGDTVWLRGGTYQPTRQIKLSKSGGSDTQRLKFWAYAKEVPRLDFAGYVTTNAAVDVPALLVTGNWIHIRGLEIANVPVGPSGAHSISALRSEGASNNTFELLNIHHNFGPGLFISKGTGGNLIQNCDSHDNYDKDGSQGDGQNADGFGVHYQESGPSTILRGCRAWLNSDDGYDLINQEVPVTIEGSWAVQNGYANGGTSSPSSGNGNGFKAGSSETGVRHILHNNVAWKNRAAGFYANHSSGGNTWLNNTSYKNAVQYNMLASPPGDPDSTITLSGDKAHKMRNNVGFPNKNSNMSGVDSMFNTWDLGIAEASNDFSSTMDTGYTGPRAADGSLPVLDFLRLRAGSPLIDKGVKVDLPFVGPLPDLGAYEFGAGTVAGGAGAGGMAGSSGSTGTSGGGNGNGNGGGGNSGGGGAGHGGGGGGDGATAGTSAGLGGTASNTSAGSVGSPVAVAGSNFGDGGSVAATGGAASAGTAARPGMTPQDAAGCTCSIESPSRLGGLLPTLTLGALGLLFSRRRRRPSQ